MFWRIAVIVVAMICVLTAIFGRAIALYGNTYEYGTFDGYVKMAQDTPPWCWIAFGSGLALYFFWLVWLREKQ